MTVMASIELTNTAFRECFNDMIAVMKNVLSPNSDAVISVSDPRNALQNVDIIVGVGVNWRSNL